MLVPLVTRDEAGVATEVTAVPAAEVPVGVVKAAMDFETHELPEADAPSAPEDATPEPD